MFRYTGRWCTHPMSRSVLPLDRAELVTPCAEYPEDWDLDAGSPERWRRAAQLCHEACPLREPCAARAQALIGRNTPPVAMIWAGIAYNRRGKAIKDLDKYHATRHKAVTAISRREGTMTIVRVGPVPEKSSAAIRSQALRSGSGIRNGPVHLIIPRRVSHSCGQLAL